MFKGLKPIIYGGREVWPLVEGGKGVAATNHASSGAWAAAGGIGTVSAVNADSYDENGDMIPQVFLGKTRAERHEELVAYGIRGGIAQVKLAHEISNGRGAININVLWEMGGAQRILHGILEATKGMVTGVTCGAGMPYKLSKLPPNMAFIICRSSAPPAPSALCGSVPITRCLNGSVRLFMKIPGSPAGTMACPMPKTRVALKTPIPA